MKKPLAVLERSADVREAARAWKENGVIDEATLRRIEDHYSDPRLRLHKVWRILIFVLGTIAILALYLACIETMNTREYGIVAFAFAVALGIGTEFLSGSRFAGTGADAATSFWAATMAVIAVALQLGEAFHVGERPTFTLVALSGFLAFGFAAWRWGFWFHAGAATASLFLFVGRLPYPRIVWIAAAVCLIPALDRFRDSSSLPPPHRRGLSAALAVAAAALYAAVNLYSLDQRFVEEITLAPAGSKTAFPRALAIAATALVPVPFLIQGIRKRRRLVLDLGLGMAALSVATLHHYRPFHPQWAFLAGWGVALILAALAIGRALRRVPRGVWRGWTGAPLASETDASQGEIAAVIAGAAASHAQAPAPRPDFEPGGGKFGGGGATGEY